MRNLTQDNITQAVIARFAQTPDLRLRELMTSLVQHLHAFARDVRLTETEWLAGIRFLTAAGQVSQGRRQEFSLLSDTLGLSMLTAAMNNERPQGCTESTAPGPRAIDGPVGAVNGQACEVRGRVLGLGGEPIAGASIEAGPGESLRSAADGRFQFRTVLAEASPIPHDGPVGELLQATGRHPWRPAHLQFVLQAEGYERLVTHVFRSGDPYLDSDAVFGVRESLVADWLRQADGSYLLEFDFVLQPTVEAPA